MATKQAKRPKQQQGDLYIDEFPKIIKLPYDYWATIKALRRSYYRTRKFDEMYMSFGIQPPLTMSFDSLTYHARFNELDVRYEQFYSTLLGGYDFTKRADGREFDMEQAVSQQIHAIDLMTEFDSLYRDILFNLQHDADAHFSVNILIDQQTKAREEAVPELAGLLAFELFEIHHSPAPYVTYSIEDHLSKTTKVIKRHKIRDYNAEIDKHSAKYKLFVEMSRSAHELRVRTKQTRAMIQLTIVLVVLTVILVLLTLIMLYTMFYASPPTQPIIYYAPA